MSGIDLTEVMQRLYASEINCAVQSQWDAGFVVSIGGDTRYGSSDASETFAADELAEAAAWLAGKPASCTRSRATRAGRIMPRP